MQTDCSICAGNGFVKVPGTTSWAACKCSRRRRLEKLYRKAGVGQRFDHTTWARFLETCKADPKPTKLLKKIREVRKGSIPRDFFLVRSSSLRVRRTIGALIARTACDGGLTALVTDLSEVVRREFDEEKSADPQKVHCLSLEVGSEPPHKWNSHIVQRLLTKRWEAKMFTVLTTNCSLTRLEGLYGPGVKEILSSTTRYELIPYE